MIPSPNAGTVTRVPTPPPGLLHSNLVESLDTQPATPSTGPLAELPNRMQNLPGELWMASCKYLSATDRAMFYGLNPVLQDRADAAADYAAVSATPDLATLAAVAQHASSGHTTTGYALTRKELTAIINLVATKTLDRFAETSSRGERLALQRILCHCLDGLDAMSPCDAQAFIARMYQELPFKLRQAPVFGLFGGERLARRLAERIDEALKQGSLVVKEALAKFPRHESALRFEAARAYGRGPSEAERAGREAAAFLVADQRFRYSADFGPALMGQAVGDTLRAI
ncbi:hypothetical protein [Xylophilus sp. GOD-11R]|uniref:hypothetical protein n=1 Tax=Xylophilus sp. GOD-11R TaxID=3089814 RepID=UPI00298CC075|nr:hypothetical protein [Xylophilus sp. GOD-11R]WPB56191.1 hypothetical protein R9X41_18895 [Xylophilus sp. GOD-11R]